MTEKDEGKRLQLSLDKLGDWEKEMSQVEREAEIYRIKRHNQCMLKDVLS